MTDTVTYSDEDGVAVITLNRPDARNALTPPMLRELTDILETVEGDDGLQAAVLTGAGDTFCAGADLATLQDMVPADVETFSVDAEQVTERLEQTGMPTVAAIHGHCLGGGHELALACDFRIAHTGASLGQPEVSLGLIPGFGATARLPRLIGTARARAMLLSGDTISADEAERIGLVDKVVDEPVEQAATAFARDILDTASLSAYRTVKEVVNEPRALSLDDAIARERAHFVKQFETDDAQEGIDAFIAGRDPDFSD